MSLKERMRKAIERKQCEIPELAVAAKVKVPSVHGWLNGASKTMKAGPAIRAAAFLGVNPLWLADGDGDMATISEYGAHIAATLHVREPDPMPALLKELVAHANKMNDRGLILLIDQAEQIAARHPKDQAKAA